MSEEKGWKDEHEVGCVISIHGGAMTGFVKGFVVGVGFQFGNFPEFLEGLGNLFYGVSMVMRGERECLGGFYLRESCNHVLKLRVARRQ